METTKVTFLLKLNSSRNPRVLPSVEMATIPKKGDYVVVVSEQNWFVVTRVVWQLNEFKNQALTEVEAEVDIFCEEITDQENNED